MTIGQLEDAIAKAKEMGHTDKDTPVTISVAAEGAEGSFVRSPESIGILRRDNGSDTLCLCAKSFSVEDAKHLLSDAEASVNKVETKEEE